MTVAALRQRAVHTAETGEMCLSDAQPFAQFVAKATAPEMRERIRGGLLAAGMGNLWADVAADAAMAALAEAAR